MSRKNSQYHFLLLSPGYNHEFNSYRNYEAAAATQGDLHKNNKPFEDF